MTGNREIAGILRIRSGSGILLKFPIGISHSTQSVWFMARSETGSTFDRSDFPIKDRVFIVCEVLLYMGKCSVSYILNVNSIV